MPKDGKTRNSLLDLIRPAPAQEGAEDEGETGAPDQDLAGKKDLTHIGAFGTRADPEADEDLDLGIPTSGTDDEPVTDLDGLESLESYELASDLEARLGEDPLPSTRSMTSRESGDPAGLLAPDDFDSSFSQGSEGNPL